MSICVGTMETLVWLLFFQGRSKEGTLSLFFFSVSGSGSGSGSMETSSVFEI